MDEDAWARGEDTYFSAVARHNFTAERQSELSLTGGEEVLVAPAHRQPKVRGWLLAAKVKDCTKMGLVPANYVSILSKRLPTSLGDEEAARQKPDLVRETMEEVYDAEVDTRSDTSLSITKHLSNNQVNH